MKVQDIEIPFEKDRGFKYRFFEVLPGFLSWSILILPFVLSIFNPTITVFFIIAYMLLWFVKSIGMNFRAVQGWHIMTQQKKLDWESLVQEVQIADQIEKQFDRPKWHIDNLKLLNDTPRPVKPEDTIHAVMIATYKEAKEVLIQTIDAVVASKFNLKKVIMVIAFEERGGPEAKQRINELITDYKSKFLDAFAVEHPADIPGEVIGKGGNITYAGRVLEKYLEEKR